MYLKNTKESFLMLYQRFPREPWIKGKIKTKNKNERTNEQRIKLFFFFL